MIYDLYLDESGKFEVPGEPVLIGGFLLPHSVAFTEKDAKEWRMQLKRKLIHKGLQTSDILRRGEEMHVLRKKSKRAEGPLLEQLQQQERDLSAQGYYIFDHCSENLRDSHKRSETQSFVLNEIAEKIAKLHGKIVIFDDPNGEYHIDSDTTFLSVFSLGFVGLFSLLTQEDHEQPVIHVHASERMDITAKYQKELLPNSPVSVKENGNVVSTPTILSRQYIEQIRNCAFLSGGHDLLESKNFKDSLNLFEIIAGDNGKEPDPYTVLCDYICNSFINRHLKSLQPVIENMNPITILISTFEQNLRGLSFKLDTIRNEKSWGPVLTDLISRKFPTPVTQEFFDAFRTESYQQQMNAVGTVVQYLYPFINERINMKLWISRLEKTIEQAKVLDDQVFHDFSANLLLYMHALYTHLGDDKHCKIVEQRFMQEVQAIRDVSSRDKLILLYLNRTIVTDIDSFKYTDAELHFEMIQNFWENYEIISDDLINAFTSQDLSKTSINPDYAKAIGSYLQLTAHKIHIADPEVKRSLLESAQPWIQKSVSNFANSRDISRAHQNIADIYAEAGEYKLALDELLLSIGKNHEFLDSNLKEKLDTLFDYIGTYGEKKSFSSAFLLQHVMLIILRSISDKDNSAIGKEMLEHYLSLSDFSMERVESNLTNNTYPYPVILWHIASALARSQLLNISMSKKLVDWFNLAYSMLVNKKSLIFYSIAVAIKAEEIDLADQGLLQADDKTRREWLRQLTDTYILFKQGEHEDPFAGLIDSKTAVQFKDVYGKIAY